MQRRSRAVDPIIIETHGVPYDRRERVWRHDVVASAIEQASLWIAHHREGLVSALDCIDSQLRARRHIGAWDDELAAFARAAAALRSANASEATRARAAHYFRVASSVLHRSGIASRGSRLSHLHDELRRELHRYPDPATDQADWTFEHAGSQAALELLERELTPASALDQPALALARIRILRLSGQYEAAARMIDELACQPANDLAWEAACIAAIASSDAEPLDAALRTRRCATTPARLAVLKLWGYASASKQWIHRGRRARALRHAVEPLLGRALVAVERGYDTRLPLATRIAAIDGVHDAVHEIDDIGDRVLALGAVARWYSRAKQATRCELAAARYHALCTTLSDGRTRDLFNLKLRTSDAPSRPVRDPSRLRTVAAVAASYLRARVGHREAQDYLDILAAHASVLGAPAIKLAQIIAFYGFELPPSTRELLAALHDSVPRVLPVADVRRQIEAELGCALDRAFASFDERPHAAGSIGQVHCATRHDGSRVVVKIQYPGVERALRDGLRALRLGLPIVRSLQPVWAWDDIAAELAQRVLEECDYLREARHQQWFRDTLADDPRLVVPRVHHDLSTRRVLVSDYVGGEPCASFARQASPAARARAARTLVGYVLRTVVCEGCINTDLHPGNLLFDGERVGVVDFGSVRRWSPDEAAGFRVALDGLLADDIEAVERAARMLRLWSGDSAAMRKPYDLLRTELMGALLAREPRRMHVRSARESISLFIANLSARDALELPPRYLFAFRLFWGLIAVLDALDVEVDYRAVLEDVARKSAVRSASEPGVTAVKSQDQISQAVRLDPPAQ